MAAIKSIVFHKLSLRLLYISAAYSTSHIVGLAASPRVTALLSNAGVLFKVENPMKLKTAITAAMLFGGEFAYHFIHEKFVLPHVVPNQTKGEST